MTIVNKFVYMAWIYFIIEDFICQLQKFFWKPDKQNDIIVVINKTYVWG